MKPSWKDAPSWANYLAQDLCGEWWWFELQPHFQGSYPSCWVVEDGDREQAIERNENWKDSLEPRPAAIGESCE